MSPFISQWYTKHFPAVRLNHKLTPLEYGLNFSSEILVAILVIIVAAVNVVVFNPFKSEYNQQDKSLAAYLLRYHTNLNNQLALKHNMVSTTVSNGNGFISQAFADNTGSVLGATDTAEPESTEDGIEDNGITKANPNAVQKLVSRQVQIYETKPFDTVYTVAAQFKLTPKTIRDTNGLPDNALKAGWYLVIPPVDGIVIEVSNPDLSIYDISQKYHANLDQIVSYNGLDGPDSELSMGDYLVIPGGVVPEVTQKPAAPSTPGSKPATKSTKPSIQKANFKGTNKFVPGQCTYYVASRVSVYWRGNARDWARNARAAGATVNKTPAAGAILQTNESRYGHVLYIDSVDANGNMHTSEMNYAGPWKITHRVISPNSGSIVAIIHP